MRTPIGVYHADRQGEFSQNDEPSRVLNQFDRGVLTLLHGDRTRGPGLVARSIGDWALVLYVHSRLEDGGELRRLFGIELPEYGPVDRVCALEHSSSAIWIVTSSQIRVPVRHARRGSARR